MLKTAAATIAAPVACAQHHHADGALSLDEEAKALFLEGMAQLDEAAQKKHGSAFAALNLERQTDMLKAMEADAASLSGKFFKQVKDLTIDGYYTSKPGLTVELDWHANTFRPSSSVAELPEAHSRVHSACCESRDHAVRARELDVAGSAIHEHGTCRMGVDPKPSALNRHCQSHDVPNLFVVDGSAFTTASEKNPTLTILAPAWRATDYLADEMQASRL